MKVRQSVVGHVCACLCVSALLSCVAWIVLLGKAGGINGITFQHTRAAHTRTHTWPTTAAVTTTAVQQQQQQQLGRQMSVFYFCYCFCFVRFFYIFCYFCYFLPPFVFHVLLSVVLLPRDPSLCTASSFRFLWWQHFSIIEISQENFGAKTPQRRIPSRIYDKFLSCLLFPLALLSFCRIFWQLLCFGFGLCTLLPKLRRNTNNSNN